MSEDIERLREVAERATPESWKMVERRSHDACAAVIYEGAEHRTVARFGSATKVTAPTRDIHRDNARFVATFDPPTVLALLDVVAAASDAPHECVSWRWEVNRKRGVRTARNCDECWACRLRMAVERLSGAGDERDD